MYSSISRFFDIGGIFRWFSGIIISLMRVMWAVFYVCHSSEKDENGKALFEVTVKLSGNDRLVITNPISYEEALEIAKDISLMIDKKTHLEMHSYDGVPRIFKQHPMWQSNEYWFLFCIFTPNFSIDLLFLLFLKCQIYVTFCKTYQTKCKTRYSIFKILENSIYSKIGIELLSNSIFINSWWIP